MLSNQRIDIVTPPFGGHLYPQLDLADRIRSNSGLRLHVISTPSARSAIEAFDFPHTLVLKDREDVILGIANTSKRVGANPFRLVGQLRDNLSLMDQLIAELTERWTLDRPDLVIADFAVPVAGLLAQQLGIPWWTAIRSPTVIDTLDGVPPYMGGLRPKPGPVAAIRDACGRTMIRTFKRTVHLLFRPSFRRIGIPSIYRDDGYETVYSPQRLLVQGVREFEFDCTWPPSTRFIGPLTGGPKFDHAIPSFVEGKPHVLVSLGTHVRWAKNHASQLIQAVARRMPEWEFHFTRGTPNDKSCSQLGNYHEVGYVPYNEWVGRYQASINHTGSGILYSCLREGVPVLAWPQDFDQFDNTARVIHHGLGIRCRPEVDSMVEDLGLLVSDPLIDQAVKRMKRIVASYDSTQLVMDQLDQHFDGI